MNGQTVSAKKVLWKLILASILVIIGIICCANVSSADMNISKSAANEIAVSDDASIDDIDVLGHMGTKEKSGVEYNYYVIMAKDKSGTQFTMALCASGQTHEELQTIIKSGEATNLGYGLYGSVETMDDQTVSIYDSLLEQNGFKGTYPNLYYTFNDSGNSNGLNAVLGLLCMLPFVGVAAYLCYSFYINVNGKPQKNN